MQPPVEIAVAGDDAGGDDLLRGDFGADMLGQRARAAAAGHAAKARDLKAQRIERLSQASLGQHGRDHPRARRKGGLDPWL